MTLCIKGVVFLELKNLEETDVNSLRIRLIAAVQESDQHRDQDSESLTRRPTSVGTAGKKKAEIPSVNVQKPRVKIKCPECEAFIIKERVLNWIFDNLIIF